MQDKIAKPKLSDRRPIKRRSVSTVGHEMVTQETFSDQPLPLVIRPTLKGVDIQSWVRQHRRELIEKQQKHGGLLFRGFTITTPESFEAFIDAFSEKSLLPYQDGSSPRKPVKNNIFTSTEYPAYQTIPMHSELSYADSWPLHLFFCCVRPATHGGETPIADIRQVYWAISPRYRERLAEKGVMYIRNFGEGLGVTWQRAFNTEDPHEVARYCARANIDYKWLANGILRTRQVRPAVRVHPETGEPVWFNHAAFFHISSLDAAIRESLLNHFKESELPFHACYGDGRLFESDTLAEIRQAYEKHTVRFRWQRGDLLALDNMLTAHGRMPFTGERRVLVGMTTPFDGNHPFWGERNADSNRRL